MAVSTKLIRLTETEADSAAAGETTADDGGRDDTTRDGDDDEGGPTLGCTGAVPPALADR